MTTFTLPPPLFELYVYQDPKAMIAPMFPNAVRLIEEVQLWVDANIEATFEAENRLTEELEAIMSANDKLPPNQRLGLMELAHENTVMRIIIPDIDQAALFKLKWL